MRRHAACDTSRRPRTAGGLSNESSPPCSMWPCETCSGVSLAARALPRWTKRLPPSCARNRPDSDVSSRSALRYTFATFPAHAFVRRKPRRVSGNSRTHGRGRRSRARRALHRQKCRIETTQRASKDARGSMRDGRPICVLDSSDDVVRRIARSAGCLSLSCRLVDETPVAVVKHSVTHRACAVCVARAGCGCGGGWFEYCWCGSDVTDRRDARHSEERLMT